MFEPNIRLVVMLRHGTDLNDRIVWANVRQVIEKFESHGIQVSSFGPLVAGSPNHITAEPAQLQTVVVTLGGDGTFMTACREFANVDATIVGIAAGSLNFLTSFSSIDDLDDLFTAGHKISERAVGQFQIHDEGHDVQDTVEVFSNDLVVAPCGHQMIDIEITDGRGRHLAAFKGDGVLISTPMGSTAYNLSVGGPLMHPTMNAFIVTPRAPQHMAARPIILPMETGLRIFTDKESNVIMDGIKKQSLNSSHCLMVDRGPDINVALPEDYSFFLQARQKLGWFK